MNTRVPQDPSKALEFVAGQKVANRYVLGRRVESGGVVWLAYDEVRGREFSLHFLAVTTRSEVDLVDRLKAWVERLSAVVHPHVLRVHELIEAPLWVALVMDKVEPENLAGLHARRSGRALEPAEVSAWVVQAARGLEAGLSAGLTHGRLIPAALFFQKSSRLQVAYLGLERVWNPLAVPGEDLDAIGLLMHHLLTGGAPRLPEDAVVGALAARRAALKAGGSAAFISPALEKTAAACLSSDPAVRLSGVAEVAVRLTPGKAPLPQAPGASPETGGGGAHLPMSPSQLTRMENPGRVRMPPIGLLSSRPPMKSPELEPVRTVRKRPEIPPVFPVFKNPAMNKKEPGVTTPVAPALESEKARALEAKPVAALEALSAEVVAPVLNHEQAARIVEGANLEVLKPQDLETAVQMPVVCAPVVPMPEVAAVPVPVPVAVVPEPVANLYEAQLLPLVPSPGSGPLPKPLRAVSQAAPLEFPAAKESAPGGTKRRLLRVLGTVALIGLVGSYVYVVVQGGQPLDKLASTHPTPEPSTPLSKPPLTPKPADAKRDAARIASIPPVLENKPSAEPKAEAPAALSTDAVFATLSDAPVVTPPAAPVPAAAADPKALEAERKKAEQKAYANSAAALFGGGLTVVVPSAAEEKKDAAPAVQKPAPEESKPIAAEAPPAEAQSPFENSLGMKFVPAAGVLFSIWDTRISDFRAFVTATKFRSQLWLNPDFKQAPDHPVVYVSWLDAVGFCKWLTEKEHAEGVLAATQSYRLPTDLEWSKAAGLPEEKGDTPAARDMGVSDCYPWGNVWPPPADAGNYFGEESRSSTVIKGFRDKFVVTSPVGSFAPNAAGLYDMGGNVWQWCQDAFSSDKASKVLRGASWSTGLLKPSMLAPQLLSSCRMRSQQDNKANNFGFRIVLVSE